MTRTRSTEDERSLNIEITAAGEALKERALKVPQAMAECSRIEGEDALALYRILYKILGKEE